ncbi:hypothetical protein E2C01_042940 [Portunus trituberculatus]|uniref:Uncharacterized protein n=1 Tax=Portunus trituberculatus TaxID=210409 RepID=A0A5B7FUX7_PORTR|nr:hypothetical protein [Portunus trituberculatus]
MVGHFYMTQRTLYQEGEPRYTNAGSRNNLRLGSKKLSGHEMKIPKEYFLMSLTPIKSFQLSVRCRVAASTIGGDHLSPWRKTAQGGHSAAPVIGFSFPLPTTQGTDQRLGTRFV